MERNKDWSISIRVEKNEYFWMDFAARSEDLSHSSFLRRIMKKHLKENYSKYNPELFAPDKDEIKDSFSTL